MNQLETRVLLNLLHQNEHLLAIVHRLLEERDHDRYSRASGHAGVRIPVERVPGTATADSEFPAPDGSDRVLQPPLGLDADRGEPRPDDSAGADARGHGRLSDAEQDWLVTTLGLPAYSGGDRGLHSAGGPGAGAEPGDRGGDPLLAGTGDPGAADGRLGEGDAEAGRADCRRREGCKSWAAYYRPEGWAYNPCPDCADYEPLAAAPAAVVETRHCRRCDRDLPLTEFEPGKNDCRACQTPPAGPYRHCRRCERDLPLSAFSWRVRTTVCNECHARPVPPPAVVAVTAPAGEPPKPVVAGRIAAGQGTCACGHIGDLWARTVSGPNEDGLVACLACLQAAEREKPHCIICGQPIVGRRPNAQTCRDRDCQREQHRRQCAADYAKKKAAAAAGVIG